MRAGLLVWLGAPQAAARQIPVEAPVARARRRAAPEEAAEAGVAAEAEDQFAAVVVVVLIRRVETDPTMEVRARPGVSSSLGVDGARKDCQVKNCDYVPSQSSIQRETTAQTTAAVARLALRA